MKIFKLLFVSILLALLSGCNGYDDSKLQSDVDNLKSRVSALEQLCKNLNDNISSLQTIVSALQNSESVTSVTNLPDNTGYTITFKSGKTINIYNGSDGATPKISVRQDADGEYYWTVDGEWLIVAGKKVKAIGKDGSNGSNGITPKIKIEDGYWYISYDEEKTWTKLGEATGEDGNQLFSSVYVKDRYVCFVLSDGTTLQLPMAGANAVRVLSYIPRYADGKSTMWFYQKEDNIIIGDKDTLDFLIKPLGEAAKIASSSEIDVTANLAYNTITRSPITIVDLPVISVDSDEDILSVILDGSSISSNFFLGKQGASIRINITSKENEITSESILTVPAEKKYAEEKKIVDLSSTETANCYIVSSEGMYSLNATIIGNGESGIISDAFFHSETSIISPSSAKIIWDDNNVITDLKYSSGNIVFTASSNKGNALIAAVDTDGVILWSWHIWATDVPTTYTGPSNSQIMDRNLGATSAMKEDRKKTYGLYYQWGRKDPFHFTDRIRTSGTATTGTIPYTITHPDTQIIAPQSNRNWLYADKSTELWGYASDKKTIYDPCPQGYRVMSEREFTISNTIYDATYIGRSYGSLWFPFASRIDPHDHDTYYDSNGALYHMNSESNSTSNCCYDLVFFEDEIRNHNLQYKDFCESIRCQKQ